MISEADAYRLEQFLKHNYPNVVVPNGNIVDWAINALIETDEQAGTYSGEVLRLTEKLDIYRATYGDL